MVRPITLSSIPSTLIPRCSPIRPSSRSFAHFYIRKYQNRKPDVIITVGPSPLKFMEEVHQRAFPGVPIVFCLPNGNVPGAPALDSDFTGVENDMAPAETVKIGLQLQPGTKNVVVVGGVAPFDREGLAAVKKALKPYEGSLDISYLTDLPVPDLLERLQALAKSHSRPSHLGRRRMRQEPLSKQTK